MSLIDLYFPAHMADIDAIVEAAAKTALDGVILVAAPDELPQEDELAALNDAEGPAYHTASVVSGVGFRFAVLLPGDAGDISLDAIEASGDPALIKAAIDELGGAVLPICPRQGVEGEVHRQVALLPEEALVGVVGLVAAGSRLGRDLDIEDAGVAQRPVLGATGPFGGLDDLGRYASLIPAEATDRAGIIRALNAGQGMAVELGRPRHHDSERRRDDGRHKNAGGEQGDGKKKRRRRRRRKPKDGAGPPPAATA